MTITFDEGVLFFPVTPFDASDRPELGVLTDHIVSGVESGAAGVFAACGTGEYHALSVSEYEKVAKTAVASVAGRVPVLTGTGGPLGHAREVASVAADAGADGLLVMPPYLVQGSAEGVVSYIEAIADVTELPLIAYHRANAALSESAVAGLLDIDSVVGIKDGVGDIALMQRLVLAAANSDRDILFFNGLLTAELSQAAYQAIGVPLYSSAVFAMEPDIANAFFRALRDGDNARQRLLLDQFYVPLVRLRDETPGFAVSLIKAGLRLRGGAVGGVRPPLTDPTPEQVARLDAILRRGRELVA